MHTTPLYRANFVGMTVRVIEQKGNPCRQPELQRHFHSHHKLVLLTTTLENEHIAAGYWHVKLATVKDSWNPVVKNQFTDPHTIIIGNDEAVIGATYGVDIIKGMPADIVELRLKSMCDAFEYLIAIRIHHGMKPLIPMQHT